MTSKKWNESMPEKQFELMRDIIGAPSPVGLEGSMTYGILKPYFESFAKPEWKVHQFRGNAGVVLDTHPGQTDMLTVMIIGHADKIRLQVRSIGDDGKIWIDSDSFLPTTLIGHEVVLFSENPDEPGAYRALEGGTIEAIGAIHFADSALIAGEKGIKKDMLYLELQIHGESKREQIEKLGIRPGDALILNRKIKRGFSKDTYYGAYLDNGLGCFVTAEIARLVAEAGGLDNVRCLFTIATHEEIGRMGSRVAAGIFRPDIVIGADVSHDYKAAPGIGDRRMTPIEMGKGFSIKSGSIISEYLNSLIEQACRKNDVPYQKGVAGRDTGTDAMAGVFAAIDAAATTIGFPIRNMHTISETGHTGDVLTAIWGLFHFLEHIDAEKITADDFSNRHPRLDQCSPLRAAEL